MIGMLCNQIKTKTKVTKAEVISEISDKTGIPKDDVQNNSRSFFQRGKNIHV